MSVIDDIGAERVRQNEKWGEQNHLDGTGPEVEVLHGMSLQRAHFLDWETATHLADAARRACKANGSPESPDTWAAILLEEVFEALAEDDAMKLRTELVQVAAVATHWIEAIDRRVVR